LFRYSLVGYFTLFHFNALFHKPEPGWILRICQALVLPPFQGQGHGKRLLQAVYNMAHQHQHHEEDDENASGAEQAKSCNQRDVPPKIIQVNVEDPAPAFIALRNYTDWKLVLGRHREWNWPQKGSVTRDDDDDDSKNNNNNTTTSDSKRKSKVLAPVDELALFFSAMTEKEASEMSTNAKISPKQIHVTNELLKLRAARAFLGEECGGKEVGVNVNVNVSNGGNKNRDDIASIERCFRLMVKRRLNKEHREELLELPSKDDQKAMLAKLFEETLKAYERILSKI